MNNEKNNFIKQECLNSNNENNAKYVNNSKNIIDNSEDNLIKQRRESDNEINLDDIKEIEDNNNLVNKNENKIKKTQKNFGNKRELSKLLKKSLKIKFNVDNELYEKIKNENIKLKSEEIIYKRYIDELIEIINNLIAEMKYIIKENNNNLALIINHINKIQNQLDILEKVDYKKNNIKLKLRNGKYIGQILNGLREGKGIMYYYNGDRYEGEYRNNNREGKGIMYYNNGDRYEGYYKKGKKEGKGIFYYTDGSVYDGDFKKSKSEGKGIFYYNNGDRYEGEFKDGKIEGKGIIYYNNGDIYEGYFRNEEKEGKGIYYYNNGDREISDYLNG